MTDKNKIFILIPAFNEEPNITQVIENIRKNIDAKIVIIDDGSSDNTAEIARSKGVYVISHVINMGYGAALQTGYKFAMSEECDWIIQMDADGQHSAECIKDFLKEIESGRSDVIIGSRFLGTLNYEISKARKIGMFLFRSLASFITKQKITDPTSGFQALDKDVLNFCTSDFYPADYPDADFIIMLHYEGFRIKEIPVIMNANKQQKSMHGGVLKPAYYVFKMLLSILVTYLRELEKRKKIRK